MLLTTPEMHVKISLVFGFPCTVLYIEAELRIKQSVGGHT